MKPSISHERLSVIKLFVSDVDGVLTDGNVIYGSGGVEVKAFNIKDGLGIRLAVASGLPVILLTGRTSEAVSRRAGELGIQVIQGVGNKDAGLRAIAREAGVTLDEIAYIGDDLNDLPAFRITGLPIAVADAAPEILAAAAYVTRAPGGHGAVREALEYLLRGQGRWESAVAGFLAQG